jgi:hypothetical protein
LCVLGRRELVVDHKVFGKLVGVLDFDFVECETLKRTPQPMFEFTRAFTIIFVA